jgi:hypothetical protein
VQAEHNGGTLAQSEKQFPESELSQRKKENKKSQTLHPLAIAMSLPSH